MKSLNKEGYTEWKDKLANKLNQVRPGYGTLLKFIEKNFPGAKALFTDISQLHLEKNIDAHSEHNMALTTVPAVFVMQSLLPILCHECFPTPSRVHDLCHASLAMKSVTDHLGHIILAVKTGGTGVLADLAGWFLRLL